MEQEFVTKDVCFEKEKSKDMQICNVEKQIADMRIMFVDLIATFKEDKQERKQDNEIRRQNEAKLFKTSNVLNVAVAELCKETKSIQSELTEHKEIQEKEKELEIQRDGNKINKAIGIASILSGLICGFIGWLASKF
jgi:uncharacterized protein YlxW (UPF0749 family)